MKTIEINKTIKKRWEKRTRRNRPLLTALLVGLVCLYLISLRAKIEVAQDLLLEVFSTSVQIFAALMALLGMVAVFKLELVSHKIEELSASAEGLITYFCGVTRMRLLSEEVLKEAKKVLKSEHPAGKGEERQLRAVATKLENLFGRMEKIKAYMLDFMVFSSVVILVSLVLLVCAPSISFLYLGVPAMFLVLALSTLALFSLIGLIEIILG